MRLRQFNVWQMLLAELDCNWAEAINNSFAIQSFCIDLCTMAENDVRTVGLVSKFIKVSSQIPKLNNGKATK